MSTELSDALDRLDAAMYAREDAHLLLTLALRGLPGGELALEAAGLLFKRSEAVDFAGDGVMRILCERLRRSSKPHDDAASKRPQEGTKLESNA